MKNLLCILPLLLGLAVSTAHAQTLTLDQLIVVHSRPAMEVDAYLATRGWKFYQQPAKDSVAAVYWTHEGQNGISGTVSYTQKTGEQLEVLYVTPNRADFAAIQSRLTALSAKRGQTLTMEGELWTQYFTFQAR